MPLIVGFIDLSKAKTTHPRRSESRRLDSFDDFMPTCGRPCGTTRSGR
jgi:hypothetical protein